MNESRFATKVGLFVFAGLVALAVLLLNFSKSGDWFKPTYEILMRTGNVSGIKKRAAVLKAGVPIGYVKDIRFAEDGTNVILTTHIYVENSIPRNSIFAIEQSGFLGDQYVAINPRDSKGALLADGDIVKCSPPFDLQDTARRASDLLDNVGNAVYDLKSAISNVNGSLLSQTTLTNLATNVLISMQNLRVATESVRSNVPVTLTNFQAISATALRAAADLQSLVQAHTSSVSRAILHLEDASSNVTAFTVSLRRSGTNLEDLIEVNSPRVSSTLKNVETASSTVTNMLLGLQADLNNGKGLVGALFKDEELKNRTEQVSGNLVGLSSNLNVAAAHLNQHGLWWLLWKPKAPKTNSPASVKPAMGKKW